MGARMLLGALTAVLAWGLSYPAAWLARALGAMDRPGPRRINPQPMPRLGGVAVFGAVLCALALRPGAWLAPARPDWLLMVAAASAVFVVGFIDDLRTLGVVSRLLVEAGAALAVALGFARFAAGPGALGTAAAIALSALWLVVVSNGSNLIDGLDGLTVGVALLEIAGLGVIAAMTGRPMVLRALAITGGAWAGFWLRNRHPARIFAGDGGALLAGFSVAAITLRTMDFRAGLVGIEAAVLVMAYPLIEVLITVGRRAASAWQAAPSAVPPAPRWRGALVALFRPDRDHIHHRLLERGWSHGAAVHICYLLAAVMVAAGVVTALWPRGALPVALLAVATLLWFARFVGYLRWNWRAPRMRVAAGASMARRRAS